MFVTWIIIRNNIEIVANELNILFMYVLSLM